MADRDRWVMVTGGTGGIGNALIAIKALFKNRFSARAVVGRRTSAMLMLSRLPIRARDRLVKGALGLSAALKALA